MVQSREAWRQEAFGELFGDLADEWPRILNMTNWTLHWQMAEPIDEEDGTIEGQCKVQTDLGYQAWITLADRLIDEPAERREQVIVHELLHVKLDELFQFLAHYLEEEHHAYFRRLVEIVVDDLARVLVRMAGEIRAGQNKDGEEAF